MKLTTASFTVRAIMAQSVTWKRAAEAEGFASVGSWAGRALDAYLRHRAKAGLPLPLAWHFGSFTVALDDGRTPELRGLVSPPFAIFHGTGASVIPRGTHRHTLTYLPTRRIVATFRTSRDCKALAAELARLWVRGNGSEPSGNPAPVLTYPA